MKFLILIYGRNLRRKVRRKDHVTYGAIHFTFQHTIKLHTVSLVMKGLIDYTS